MRSPPLLFAVLLAGAGGAQAQTTSNVPERSGEASTMTNGVPNLLPSNVQPGELGIQSRLTVRQRVAPAPAPAAGPDLRTMGAAGSARDAGPGPTGQGAAVR